MFVYVHLAQVVAEFAALVKNLDVVRLWTVFAYQRGDFLAVPAPTARLIFTVEMALHRRFPCVSWFGVLGSIYERDTRHTPGNFEMPFRKLFVWLA
jgi:hypothetical protein